MSKMSRLTGRSALAAQKTVRITARPPTTSTVTSRRPSR
jgi:hypothetical protein